MDATQTLLEELRRHALIHRRGDADERRDRPVLRRCQAGDPAPGGLPGAAELVAGYARRWQATAVGGLTMGADAPACAALAGGADVKAFFVRKETKAHGLQRRIEGPPLDPGERCLIVEDVVTSGGSAVRAIEARAGRRTRGLRRRRRARPARRRRRGDRARGGRRALRAAGDDRRALPGAARPLAPDAPSRIRTCGLLLRRESLYPAELSGPTPRDRQ